MRYEKGTFITVPNKTALQGLDPLAQVLFLWLCSYADDDGTCYPSINRLAADCGMSRDTVIRKLEVLVNRKLLTRKHQFRDKYKASNLYQIMLVGSSTQQLRSSTERLGVVAHSNQGSSTQQHRTKSIELNPINSKEIKEKLTRTREALTAKGII
jgi:DNA-binding transcriptional MocR family regulator